MSTVPWRGDLLSLDDWDAMPADSRRYELVEGVPQVVPSPGTEHQLALPQLWMQLGRQLPSDLVALMDIDVLISAHPATLRRPDMIVVPASVVETKPVRYRAQDVLLAVEIVSPGSVRADNVSKLDEYAAAGIANYWVIDQSPPISLCAYQLIEDHYALDQEESGTVEFVAPSPLKIDLGALTSLRPPTE